MGGGKVAGAEVVEAGFGVAFFAGKFVRQERMLCWRVVHVGQCVVRVGFFDLS